MTPWHCRLKTTQLKLLLRFDGLIYHHDSDLMRSQVAVSVNSSISQSSALNSPSVDARCVSVSRRQTLNSMCVSESNVHASVLMSCSGRHATSSSYGRLSLFFFFLFYFFLSHRAAASFSLSICEMYMFKSGLCCSTATVLTQGRGARSEAGVRLGEGEAAYCESMPTHWVLMQFHLGHVSPQHHERKQEPCLSKRGVASVESLIT